MSFDDLQAQLRQHHERGIAEARQQALLEAQRVAETRITQLREQMQAHVEQLVAGARADAEQRARDAAAGERDAFEQHLRQELEQRGVEAVAAALADAEHRAREAATTERNAFERRLRLESEQQLVEAVAAARAETERETREAATLEWQAAEQQLRRELEENTREQLDTERQRARAVAGSGGANVVGLSDAVRDLDNSRTLTQALDVLVSHAATLAGRSALFLINGDALSAWKSAGISEEDVRSVESPAAGDGLLASAIQAGQGTWTSADLPAPPFARLPADGEGFAVPIMIGGRAVAVLYVDGSTQSAAFDLVEALARHASTVVALRTAMRTLDVLRGVPSDVAGNGDGPADDQSARRFAKLLVSEIKLYNEGAVRAGRQQRDLLQRLGAEIDRARRLYEERVPSTVGARHVYFQQELVQTLADGDPALLGTR